MLRQFVPIVEYLLNDEKQKTQISLITLHFQVTLRFVFDYRLCINKQDVVVITAITAFSTDLYK